MQGVPRQNQDSSYKALFLRYAKQVPSLKHLVEKKKIKKPHVDLQKEKLIYDVDTNPFRFFFFGNVVPSSSGYPENGID